MRGATHAEATTCTCAQAAAAPTGVASNEKSTPVGYCLRTAACHTTGHTTGVMSSCASARRGPHPIHPPQRRGSACRTLRHLCINQRKRTMQVIITTMHLASLQAAPAPQCTHHSKPRGPALKACKSELCKKLSRPPSAFLTLTGAIALTDMQNARALALACSAGARSVCISISGR